MPRQAALTAWFLPYRQVARGDIVVFHHPDPPLLVKRVVGLPGDRLRIDDGQVVRQRRRPRRALRGLRARAAQSRPRQLSRQIYTDPQVDPDWWRQMQSLTSDGELVVPPGEYFVLGDNRNHSKDSRFWGFVPRQAIVARPLVIYFSLTRPSTTDVQQAATSRG